MSQENVDVVRATYDEYAKGNLRAGLHLYDPSTVFIPVPDFPTFGHHYLGPEGLGTFMRAYLEGWTNLTMTAEELIEAQNSVVVAVRQRAAGRESDAPSTTRYFEVWTFRGRGVVRIEQFRDRAAALEAVGLSE